MFGRDKPDRQLSVCQTRDVKGERADQDRHISAPTAPSQRSHGPRSACTAGTARGGTVGEGGRYSLAVVLSSRDQFGSDRERTCRSDWRRLSCGEFTNAQTCSNCSGVQCADHQSECPDGTTCCALPDGGYGCCPMPNAVCCRDKVHCCPQGTTCDTAHSRCIQEESGETVPWVRKTPAAVVRTHSHHRTALSLACGRHSAVCAANSTCCGDRTCCPFHRGVCCKVYRLYRAPGIEEDPSEIAKAEFTNAQENNFLQYPGSGRRRPKHRP